MHSKTVLTTGDIAAHCLICPDTVINWIKDGKLKAYTTPGGHRRVHVANFKAFLRAYGLPSYGEESHSTHKVLVVDDEPDIVRLITKSLDEAHRYELATAADGFDAGLMVHKFKPDLVLLDLMMPHIDGFKVCSRIKTSPDTRHIGILVITGHGSDENIQRVQECGADDYLTKPFKIDELVMKVDELIHKKGAITSLTA